MCISDATWTTTTFCRKCKKLRECLNTNAYTNYKYLCKECAREEKLLSECRECGREGLKKLLDKQGGYCWHCHSDNIAECELCGKEVYTHNITVDKVCSKCATGKNKACEKCGTYVSSNKLSSEGLCEKCSIEIYKILTDSNVNEVVECIECGREALVNDLHEGLCIYCYSETLENEIKKLKKKKAYN
ncbi:MAG: hypothetical protein ACRCX2_11800 [Paraclostridium sp.]